MATNKAPKKTAKPARKKARKNPVVDTPPPPAVLPPPVDPAIDDDTDNNKTEIPAGKDAGQLSDPEDYDGVNGEALKEKAYAQINTNAEKQERVQVPEERPVVIETEEDEDDFEDMPPEEGAGLNSSSSTAGNNTAGPSSHSPQQQQQREPEMFNDRFNEMPKAEQNSSARNMAKMFVHGYEQLHHLANDYMKISGRKIMRLQEKGKIDLSVVIPFGPHGERMRVAEVLELFNHTMEENKLVLSEDLKLELIELLTRIFAKKGVGLSDEERLLWVLIQDVLMKGRQIFNAKRQANAIMDNLIQGTIAYKDNPLKYHEPNKTETAGSQPASTV